MAIEEQYLEPESRVGVERIFLLDSYIPASRLELIIDGHISISGNNSTGKTSMIRTLPLFFGARQSDLVQIRRKSGHKSFVEYYLPSEGSAVVFEYRTAEGLNLAVFKAHQRQIRATVIEGGYDESLFVADGYFLDHRGMLREVLDQQRDYQAFNSLLQYRKSVLGPPLRVSARDRRFNLLSGHHASGRSLQDMYRILSATLNNNVDENLLRRLIFEQSVQDAGTSLEDLCRLPINASELSEWLGNYNGIIALRRQAEVAVSAIRITHDIHDKGITESILYAGAIRRADRENDRLQDIQTEHLKVVGDRGTLADKLAHEKQDNEQKIAALAETCESTNLSIQTYDKQLKQHQESGAESLRPIAAATENRLNELENRLAELNALRSQSQDIDREIDGQIADAKSKMDQALSSIRSEQDKDREQADSQREDLRVQHENETSEQNSRHAEAIERYADLRSKAQGNLQHIEGQIQNVGPDPELSDALEACRQTAEAMQKAERDANESFAQLDADHRQAREEQVSLSHTLEGLKTKYARRQEEMVKLETDLERQGTLLEYVRGAVEGWESSIAAVLSEGPSLLYRQDLAPSPATDPSNSFYGVELNLDAIDPVEIDADDRERLETLKRELESLSEDIDATQKDLASKATEFKRLTETRDQAQADHRKARRRRTDADEAVRVAKAEVEASQQENRAALNQALAEAKKQVEDARMVSGDAYIAHGREKDDLKKRHDRERKDLAESIKARAQSLRLQEEKAENAFATTKENLERIRSQKRESAGVDEHAIRDAQKAHDEAKSALIKAREARSAVDRYDAFLDDYRAKVPDLRKKHREQARELEAARHEWDNRRSDLKKQIVQLDSTDERLRKESRSIEEDLTQLGHLTAEDPIVGTQQSLDEEDLIQASNRSGISLRNEVNQLTQDLREQVKKLRGDLGVIAKTFASTKSRMCLDFAEENDLLNVRDCAPQELIAHGQALVMFYGDASDWIEARESFPPDSHGALIELAMSRISNWTVTLKAFIQQLTRLRTQVGRHAREISQYFDSVLSNLDSVEHIGIECSMNLAQVPGFEAAQSVHTELTRYIERREESPRLLLPGPALVSALNQLLVFLETDETQNTIDIRRAVALEFFVRLEGESEGKHCRHGESLREEFSNGMGTVIVLTVLMGFLHSMRAGLPVSTPWMLDELLKLDERNSRGLLQAMTAQRIYLVTTSPNVPPVLDPFFVRRYYLSKKSLNGRMTTVFNQIEPKTAAPDYLDELLAHEE